MKEERMSPTEPRPSSQRRWTGPIAVAGFALVLVFSVNCLIEPSSPGTKTSPTPVVPPAQRFQAGWDRTQALSIERSATDGACVEFATSEDCVVTTKTRETPGSAATFKTSATGHCSVTVTSNARGSTLAVSCMQASGAPCLTDAKDAVVAQIDGAATLGGTETTIQDASVPDRSLRVVAKGYCSGTFETAP
jgi:hypothetical protein